MADSTGRAKGINTISETPSRKTLIRAEDKPDIFSKQVEVLASSIFFIIIMD
jgi:hypothetical protein